MSGGRWGGGRGPPLTTLVPGASGAPSAVMLVEILISVPGLACASSQSAASPVPESTEPLAGIWPPRPSRNLITRPSGLSTASTPGPGSGLGPKLGGKKNHPAGVGEGKVVLGLPGGAPPAVTAAAADETRLAVE